MKWYWKVVMALDTLLVLIIVLNIGLNLWINFQFPKAINRENDSAYSITYKNLEVSLLNSNLVANDVVVVPKASLKDTINKAGIYAKVHSIEVRDFKIWDILFRDKIKARSITIDHPKLILYKKNEKAINNAKSIRESVVAPFGKIIYVSDISLYRGDVKIVNVQNNKAILSVQNINLQLNGILISEVTLKQKVPFQFQNYAFRCDSVAYHPNPFYELRTKRLQASKTDLKVDYLEVIPEYSRTAFATKIPKEKDLYTVRCDSLTVSKIDWGFHADDFFFHSNVVALHHIAANIYRSRVPPDDFQKKDLYNKLLRELKFDLKVDTLKIRNSTVEYEEENAAKVGAGKLSFTHFNLTGNDICSGFKKKKLVDTKFKIKCKFMNDAPLDVNWKFNVMDKSDAFNINGTLTNFDVEKVSAFTKPYMNVTAKGIMDEVHFNFTGNDKRNSGQLAVKYDDLKFIIYQKDDRKKKNKILTFVASVFVKKDTKDKVKEAQVEVNRAPEKSFFNFLWISVADGLKKILV